jgi:hypothetical protein
LLWSRFYLRGQYGGDFSGQGRGLRSLEADANLTLHWCVMPIVGSIFRRKVTTTPSQSSIRHACCLCLLVGQQANAESRQHLPPTSTPCSPSQQIRHHLPLLLLTQGR